MALKPFTGDFQPVSPASTAALKPFSGDFDPVASAPGTPPKPRLQRSWGEAAKDAAVGIAQGAWNLAGSAVQMHQMTPAGAIQRASTESALRAQGIRPTPVAEINASGNAAIDEWKSPALRESQAELSETKGVLPTLKRVATDPKLLTQFAAEQVPMLASLGVGTAATASRAGGAALQSALARGASSEVAQRYGGQVGRAVARRFNVGAAGGLGAGFSGMGAEQDALQQDDATWEKNPDFQRRVAAGEDPQAVKDSLARRAGLTAAAIAGPVSAATGGLTARLETDIFTRNLGAAGPRALLTRPGAAQVGSAIAREGAEEAVQEGAEQFAQNVGVRVNADAERGLMEGVPEAATIGGTVGALIGGGLGVGGTALSSPEGMRVQAPEGSLQQAVEQTQAQTPMLALPAPVMRVRPDGKAATESTIFQRQQLKQDRQQAEDAALVSEREELGLSRDVNSARARHPGAAPNSPRLQNPAAPAPPPGSLTEAVEQGAQGAAAAPPIANAGMFERQLAERNAAAAAPKAEQLETEAPARPQAPPINLDPESGELLGIDAEAWPNGAAHQQPAAIVDALKAEAASNKNRISGVTRITETYNVDKAIARQLRQRAIDQMNAEVGSPRRGEPSRDDQVAAWQNENFDNATDEEIVAQTRAFFGDNAGQITPQRAAEMVNRPPETMERLWPEISGNAPAVESPPANDTPSAGDGIYDESSEALDSDITPPSGGSFSSRGAADLAASRTDGARVFPLEDGSFAVRMPIQETSDADATARPTDAASAGRPAAEPRTEAAPMASGPSAAEVPADAPTGADPVERPGPVGLESAGGAGRVAAGEVRSAGPTDGSTSTAGKAPAADVAEPAAATSTNAGGRDPALRPKLRTSRGRKVFQEGHPDTIRAYFQPGALVKAYGNTTDRVLSLDFEQSGAWKARVIRVNADGSPIPGERERTHSTIPEQRDLVAAFGKAEAQPVARHSQSVDTTTGRGAYTRGKAAGREYRDAMQAGLRADTDSGTKIAAIVSRLGPRDREWLAQLYPASSIADSVRSWQANNPASATRATDTSAVVPTTDRRADAEARASINALPEDARDIEIQRLRAELAEANARADLDARTGLKGPAAYDRNKDAAGGVAAIDLTLFKGYNTLLTDTGGDAVLAVFGQAMREVGGDAAYRRGGDEFAFLTSTPAEASAMLEALRERAGDIQLTLEASGKTYTVTGVPFAGGVGTDERTAIQARDANKPAGDRNALPGNVRPADDAGRGAEDRSESEAGGRDASAAEAVEPRASARAEATASEDLRSPVAIAGELAATSAANDLPAPSDAQIDAGNYRKGHVRLNGHDVSIENPAGTRRRPAWPPLKDAYGYIRGTVGRDKDHVDVFLTDRAHDASLPVFVVDQVDADGTFDEHKVVMGAANEADARSTYLRNYRRGWTGLGGITEMTQDAFKTWVRDPKNTRKRADGAPIKPRPNPTAGDKGTSTQPTNASAPAAQDRIEDFGETLAGARKHYAAAYAEQMKAAADVDLVTSPLSQAWPEPDYAKLLAGGAPADVVAFARAARDAVPTKPKSSWKLKGWADQVRLLRTVTEDLLGGEIPVDRLRTALVSVDQRRLGDLLGRMKLYEAVGHDTSLKGLTLRAGTYTIYNGEVQPPGGMTFYTVQRKAKASGSNWPTTLADGRTEAEAIDAFKKYLAGPQAEKARAPTRFDLYSRRGVEGYIVGKKIGRHAVDLKTFPDLKSAREYKAANQEELEQLLAKAKETPAHRNETNSPRVGIDHRAGGDVTPEQFSEQFGFRGVQFGNYVEGGRRQRDLNSAYDGLMDLAGVLGVPPRALSLNGTMGLAFGARGKGGKNAPSAHFEQGSVVINLTKRGGPGTLAHEWWHGLDNYFARQAGLKTGFASDKGGRGRPDEAGLRPEVRNAFRNVMETLASTGLRRRSEKLDQTRSKPYWATDIEMSARSFESYVIAKLADDGRSNDYLANVVREEAFGDSFPYVTADETPAVRAAFDALFDTVQSESTPEGNVRLFSQNTPVFSSSTQGDGQARLTFDAALRIKADLTARWGENAPTVILVENAEQFPGFAKVDPDYRRGEGLFNGRNTVWINVGGIRTEQRFAQVLAHEALGHFGVENVVGSDWSGIVATLARHDRAGTGTDAIRGAIADVHRRYGRLDPETFAKEVIAVMAERGVRNGLVDRVVAAVRRWLRQHMPQLAWSDADVVGLLSQADSFLRAGRNVADSRRAVAAAAFSRQLTLSAFLRSAPVAEISGKPFGEGTARDIRDRVSSHLQQLGDTVENPQLGSVRISKSGVKSSVAHGIGADKIAAFVLVPDVVRMGRIIDSTTDHDGPGRDRHIIGAPVRIDGRSYLMGVVLRKQTGQDANFYLHEVTLAPKTQNPDGPSTGSGDERAMTGGSVGAVRSVLLDAFAGNRDSVFSLPPVQLQVDGRGERRIEMGGETFLDRAGSFYLVDEKGQPRDFLTLGAASEAALATGGEIVLDPSVEGGRSTWSVVVPDVVVREAATGRPLFSKAAAEHPSGPDPSRPFAPTVDLNKIRLDKTPLKAHIKGGLDWLKQHGWLPMLPINYLVDYASPGQKAPAEFMRIRGLMDSYRGERHAKYSQHTQDWLAWASKNRQAADDLAKLMHEATLAKVDPSGAVSEPLQFLYGGQRFDATPENAKMAVKEVHKQIRGRSGDDKSDMYAKINEIEGMAAAEKARPGKHAQLRAQFLKLPAKAQELFTATRDAYKEAGAEWDSVLLESIQQEMSLAEARADRGLEQKLRQLADDGLEGEELAKARTAAEGHHARQSSDRAKANAARLRLLREEFESMRTQGPYFPLARFGDYFVTVRNAEGKLLYFDKFENSGQRDQFAQQVRAEGKKAGWKVKTGLMSNQDDVRGAVDATFMASIEETLGEYGATWQLKDAVWQRYLETLPGLSTRKHFIHRKGTAGYHADALRGFGDHMFHASHQIAKLRYGAQLRNTVDIAREEVRNMEDSTQADMLVNELEHRLEWVLNPQGGSTAQKITSTAFVWNLAISPAAALVNWTQTPMLGVPILGARMGGVTRAAAALLRASADLTRSKDWHVANGLKGDEKRAMEEFLTRGLLDRTQSHMLAGVGDVGVKYSAKREKWMNRMSWLFHHLERINRETTSLAAYRMAIANGLSHENAVDKAVELTHLVHFDMSNSARARYLQSDTAKVLMVHRSHSLNMSYRMLRDAHQMIRGETAEDRAIARRQFVGIMGMHALLAGVAGVPFYGLAMMAAGVFKDLLGDDDDERSPEDMLKGLLYEAMPKEVADLLLYGAPSTATGLSLYNRIGFPDFFFRSPSRELEGKAEFDYWVSQILGPAMGMPAQVFTGVNHVRQGEFARGVESMLPKGIRDVLKSARYQREGVLSLRGDPVVDDLNAWELIGQGAGFAPFRVSEAYEQRSAKTSLQTRILVRRSKIMNRYALGARQQDQDMMREAIRDLQRFNRAYPEVAITPDGLRQSLKVRAARSARNQLGGMVLDQRLERRIGQDLGY